MISSFGIPRTAPAWLTRSGHRFDLHMDHVNFLLPCYGLPPLLREADLIAYAEGMWALELI